MVKASGGTTAYSDKHTGAYTMLQGASGNALDEIYDPEQAANGDENITDSAYDMLHVRRMHAALAGRWYAQSSAWRLSIHTVRVIVEHELQPVHPRREVRCGKERRCSVVAPPRVSLLRSRARRCG